MDPSNDAVVNTSFFFIFQKMEPLKSDGPQRILPPRTFGRSSPLACATSAQSSCYLDSHVGVGEDHVKVVMGHAEIFPQLCDQILVHQVLLTKTLHGPVVFWRGQEDGETACGHML